MWRVKITIECSIGKRPDQNSVLYITTIDKNTTNMQEYHLKSVFKIKALQEAFKQARWWFTKNSISNVPLSLGLKNYEGFRLVSIEEL